MTSIDRPKIIPSFRINSQDKLQQILGLTRSDFERAALLSEHEKYSPKEVAKSSGTTRIVYRPHPYIRKIQQKINKRIFRDHNVIQWPDHLFGSIRNQFDDQNEIKSKDYVACAGQHPNAKSILKADIKDFFDNISDFRVSQIYTEFLNVDFDIAELLTDITCFEGHLVQGALTSSYIAALVLHDVEDDVVRRLRYKRIRYTRYVDDITVSSLKSDYSFDLEFKLINDMLSQKDLALNVDKTRIQTISTEPLSAHGLRISFDKPRLPAQEVARIRAAVKNIENLALEPNFRTSLAYRRDYNRCLGRVNKLKRLENPKHGALLRRLLRIRPLPSYKDVSSTWIRIKKLEQDFADLKTTYRYEKRYNVTIERITLIDRRFKSSARSMRARLLQLVPLRDDH